MRHQAGFTKHVWKKVTLPNGAQREQCTKCKSLRNSNVEKRDCKEVRMTHLQLQEKARRK